MLLTQAGGLFWFHSQEIHQPTPLGVMHSKTAGLGHGDGDGWRPVSGRSLGQTCLPVLGPGQVTPRAPREAQRQADQGEGHSLTEGRTGQSHPGALPGVQRRRRTGRAGAPVVPRHQMQAPVPWWLSVSLGGGFGPPELPCVSKTA